MPKTDMMSITEQDIENANRDFSELLDSLSSLKSKKKMLWSQIFQNALSDRHNAFLMFQETYDLCLDPTTGVLDTSSMAIHGKTLGVYMEMQKKANDQLLRLADLIAQEEEKQRHIDVDEAYESIRGSQ